MWGIFFSGQAFEKKGGRRLYSEDIINTLRIIRNLINEEGYTVKGVKKYLNKNKKNDIKKDGSIKISEELDAKLEHISQYLKKAKSILISEK